MTKWKTVLALLLLYAGVAMDWNWIWGVLFIFWTVPSLYSGTIYFVEEVDRRRNPALFWWIIATWLLLSVAMIYLDIAKVFGG